MIVKQKSHSNSLTLLLVEDNDSHAKLVRRVVSQFCSDINIIHFSDGQSVLDHLQEESLSADPQYPNLLLLDLRLPLIDGLDVLSIIKKDTSLKKIPVVVFSSSENVDEINQAYELGTNSYLIKPIDYEKLKELIGDVSKYWLNLNRIPPLE